jgi:hypothetical protein
MIARHNCVFNGVAATGQSIVQNPYPDRPFLTMYSDEEPRGLVFPTQNEDQLEKHCGHHPDCGL